MVKYKGSALLTALFIITLVAIIATAISVRIRNDIQQTQIIEITDRLYLASQAANIWAMDRITDPKQNLNKSMPNGVILSFPPALQHIYPNISIASQVFDLQGHLNLNNLINEQFQAIFYNLLGTLHIGTNSFERKEILDAVINWMQPPRTTTTHDEWHDKYARQKPTYFPSQMPMYHHSELRLVYGISANDYRRLSPFVAALPEATAINLNTAPKPILAALGTGMKEDDINHILQTRSSTPYKDMQELNPLLAKYHIPNGILSVESNYFLVNTTVKSDDLAMQTFVVLKREQDKSGSYHVRILSQSINTP